MTYISTLPLCLSCLLLSVSTSAAAEARGIPSLESAPILLAHGGGLNRYGCHNDNIHGGYHCHRGSSQRAPRAQRNVRPRARPSVQVTEIQEMLAALGYNPGEADGLMGPNTRQAIRRFEQATGRGAGSLSESQLLAALRTNARPAPTALSTPSGSGDLDEPTALASTRLTLQPNQPATPRGNLGMWITTADYPSSALRKEMQGVTEFRVAVDIAGRVSECTVTVSSGHNVLDKETCENIERRARFSPATDPDGQPVTGTFSSSVRWSIPN